jgi:hypothetical protein
VFKYASKTGPAHRTGRMQGPFGPLTGLVEAIFIEGPGMNCIGKGRGQPESRGPAECPDELAMPHSNSAWC